MTSDNHSKPRPATVAERHELLDYLTAEGGGSSETEAERREYALTQVETAYLAVLDNYNTGYPVYEGKVLVAVWQYGPECNDAYIWVDGELHDARRVNTLR